MAKRRQWFSLPKIAKFQTKHGGHVDHRAAWIELFPWINQVGPQPERKRKMLTIGLISSATHQKKLGNGLGMG